ncbi:MAG: hypothetical protein JO131_05360, partial [Gammaproteobacteria bacterium]|nr:hypothetical protein [Gammaproteobacteria bacterium]
MLHHQLVNHMKELNYIVNEAGMCHGLACMGLQAVLLHDTQRLKRRLEVLAEIPENKLQTAIHSAEERRAQKHRIVKKLLQEKLQKKWNMVLSDNEKISFEKKLTAENQFTYYKELSDALSKADEELDEKDSILLSIPAFFDGIAVYFDPVNYSDLFEKDPNIILISKESFAEKKPNTNQIFVTLEEGKLKCKMLYEKEIKNILIDEEKWQKKLPPHFYKDLSIVL